MNGHLFTIGHSNHPWERFAGLLRQHRIEAVADVRSHPYSRHNPQFRNKNLERLLKESGTAYVFLGRELGARSDNPRCYRDGRVQYRLLAAEPGFRDGIERVLTGMREYRVVLLCAEKDPLQCHRMILVCRELRSLVGGIRHILADGSVETNDQSEARLMRLHDLAPDMLSGERARVEHAYELQAERIAYTPASRPPGEVAE